MSYIFSKHEYDLLRKLSGKFYDEYDDRIRLGWDHVIRELPNGVKDEISNSKKTQNVSNTLTLNGTESWNIWTANNTLVNTVGFIRSAPSGVKTGQSNDEVIMNCSNINAVSFNVCFQTDSEGISLVPVDGRIVVRITKTKLDGYADGLTNAEKVNLFKAWLSTALPLLNYQLAEPVEIPLPENMDPNTLEICRMSELLDKLVKSFIAGGGTMI